MAVAFAHGVKQQVGITCYEGATPTAPAAPTIEVSVDGGAFAAADNAAAYDAGTAPDGYLIQGACVFVTLSATEMTSAVVVVRVTDGNLTEAQYGGPYYPGGHYTAARGDALDNLDAAVSSRLSAADVEPAPANMSLLDITALGEVNVGAVAGTAVTGPDDFKANVSNIAADAATAVWAAGTRTLTGFGTLVADVVEGVWAAAQRTLTAFGFTPSANVTQVAGSAVEGVNDFKADVSALALEATVGTLNNISSAETQAAATAALNAYGPPTKAELDAAVLPLALEATLNTIKGVGWSDETLVALDAAIAAIGSGGDATEANQTTIISHLTDIKGVTWSTETLVALKVLLDAVPTATEVDTELTANHGAGAWGADAGSGSNTCKYTFVDTAGAVLANTTITVKTDVDGVAGTVVATPSTDGSGLLTVYLDNGTYHLINPTTNTHEGEDNTVVVDGAEIAIITVTATTIPAPPSSEYCVVHGYPSSVTGVEGTGTVRITRVWSPTVSGTGASAKDITFGREDAAPIEDGSWQLNILRGAIVNIKLDLTNGKSLERIRLIVPQAASVNWQEMAVAS